MTRQQLKDELAVRIALHYGEDDIDSVLAERIDTLVDQYEDDRAVKVQCAIESEAKTIAERVRDTIKERPW